MFYEKFGLYAGCLVYSVGWKFWLSSEKKKIRDKQSENYVYKKF